MADSHSHKHSHAHATPGGGNERALRWALALTATFLVAEVIGGLLANSLALLSDAAHMFTDVAALAISLAAIGIARRPTDRKRSFGYYRFEILAAAINALLLFGVAIYILIEAYLRFKNPPEIQSTTMLVIASIGFIVNLISIRLLTAGKDSSLNVKGVYLEVWSDLLGSVGVIVGALVIRFTGWLWVDTVVAVGIGLWVLSRTWVLLKQSLHILLEGVPEEIDYAAVEQLLARHPGVLAVHDLHVWALTSGKISLTAHLVHDATIADASALRQAIEVPLAKDFGIRHTTLQLETTPCHQAGNDGEHFGDVTHPRS